MQESIPKAYKPWLILSLVVLVGSLFLLACAVGASFYFFAQQATPLWVVLLGVLAVLGVVAGFGTLLLMMLWAGYKSFNDEKKIQVLPPD